MKTTKQIQSLKENWLNDPCWDIEETEGFEDHKDELKEYRLKCEDEQNEKYRLKLNQRALQLRISPEIVEKIESKFSISDEKKREVGKRLVHYFNLSIKGGTDLYMVDEIIDMVDTLTECTQQASEAAILKFVGRVIPFLDHKPTCNMKKDTREWIEAVGDLPESLEKEIEVEKIRQFESTCTCGLHQIFDNP